MNRRIYNVSSIFEESGQTAPYDNEESAIQATEQDYFKTDFYKVNKIKRNGITMYYCTLYRIDYDVFIKKVTRLIDDIYNKIYCIIPKNNNPDKLIEYLKDIEKHIEELEEEK